MTINADNARQPLLCQVACPLALSPQCFREGPHRPPGPTQKAQTALAENRRNCADTWLRGMVPVRKDTKQGP